MTIATVLHSRCSLLRFLILYIPTSHFVDPVVVDIHTALDLLVSVSEPNTQSTSPDDQRGKRCPTISSVVPPVVNPDLGDNIKTDGV